MYPLKAVLPAPLYWPYRAMRALGVGFCFACFWGGAVLIAWLWLPFLWLWPGSRDVKMRRVHRTVCRAMRFFHFTMRTLRLYHRTSPVTVLRPAGVVVEGPAVLIANHPTLCDVTSIVSSFSNVVALARPSLANQPLVRWLVRSCGFVPVGLHMMKDCQDRLRSGYDVMIFPEGTRSPMGSELHPFKRGAFELAARANVPVVLIKLTCAPRALTKRLPIWKHPDRMAVLTIEPFDVIYPATSKLSSRQLAQQIEQRYRDVLGYPPPPVP